MPELLRAGRRHALLAAHAATGCGVAAQIAYPLMHGGARDTVTVLVVLALAAAAVLHAAATRGPRAAAAVVLATAGIGFVAELIGVHTGVPFGRYTYSDRLGPAVAGVPLVVAAAWTMLAWPTALTVRRLVRPAAARVLAGAWALAAFDLFLDPQMVADGRWHWHDPSPHLPGVDAVPLTNYAGWLLVALIMSAALQAVLTRMNQPVHTADRWATGLHLWLWAGWVLALGAFLGLRVAAAWGALGGGVIAVPLAISVVAGRPRAGQTPVGELGPPAAVR